ncbi:unnamed protein product [Pleuronectes platessa]|uniref:Uncharacterized protein n=1 Tax=Pleuronectes platessa TaxID=8262 RepID=A0A9N7Z5N1_PLEPL|nr:unnamed protein product [Pleuronectes platessa]
MIYVKRIEDCVVDVRSLASRPNPSQLGYNHTTSSKLRHYRALHENMESDRGGPSSGLKNDVEEALVNMGIEDSQPFTIVEDKGVHKLSTPLPRGGGMGVVQTPESTEMAESLRKQMKEKLHVQWGGDLGRPRTRWRDYISTLAWERLGIPPSELVNVAREREVWGPLLELLPPRPDPG